jgi:hypothetical protein
MPRKDYNFATVFVMAAIVLALVGSSLWIKCALVAATVICLLLGHPWVAVVLLAALIITQAAYFSMRDFWR